MAVEALQGQRCRYVKRKRGHGRREERSESVLRSTLWSPSSCWSLRDHEDPQNPQPVRTFSQSIPLYPRKLKKNIELRPAHARKDVRGQGVRARPRVSPALEPSFVQAH